MRELRSFAQRALLGLHAPTAETEDVGDLASQVAGFEAGVIRRILAQAGGDMAAAQSRLGLARNTLYDKVNKNGIRPSDYRQA